MPRVAKQLAAQVDNPYSLSALGWHLWQKGWRPVNEQACPRCGTVTVIKSNAKSHVCASRTCKANIVPLWEHFNWPEPLAAYEIWRRIVQRQWGVDINEQGVYVHGQAEELSEADIERLKQERVI